MNSSSSIPKKGNTWLLVAAGVLIGLGIGLVILFGFGPGREWLDRQRGSAIAPAVPRVNAPAPDFQLQTLDGQSLKVSDLRGRVVLINFWATWCGPCRQEMPLLQDYLNRYGERLAVLAVNDDEAPEPVRSFVEALKLHLPVLLDPGSKVTQLYRVRGFPTSVFVDPQGIIRYQHVGVLNQDTLAGYLDDLGVTK
jgi:cytochrome c biogenesis protein CcmG, thiol:disulfide interchange protein DsbE